MVNKKLHLFGLVLCMMLFFSSCIRLKDTVYLQGDIAKRAPEMSGKAKDEKMIYCVKPGDLLFINISAYGGGSGDEANPLAFITGGTNTAGAQNALSASLMGYRVGPDGCIDFPLCGKIEVAGLQFSEVERKVEKEVNQYVLDSNVAVKLLNDLITILGEVNSPGRYPLNSENINLLEAIAFGGDLTDMGNRKKIRLIRSDDGETTQMFILDVTDERVLLSPYFYLKAGDIIYVEPKRSKLLNLSATSISLLSSTISLGLTIYMLINMN
ncbi:MAG: polysaccharide biosynthesis/export family protein [Marinilabiliaceae bacterium]|nr:polysaccharide biosynthesis/export family protein [Marinilabiliaceae bacterium]